MTDVITQTCARCGAGIHGTNFCENCGNRAVGAAVPATAALGTPLSTPARQHPATYGLRVTTLLLFLLTIIVPAIMSALPPTDNEYALQNGIGATLEVFTGFFALLAAVAGPARGGARWGGAILALGYITLAMIDDFTRFFYASTLTLEFGGSFVVLLLFLSWAVSRPFRGPGYFGILVFAALEFADALLVPAVYGAGGGGAQILIALIGCAFTLGLVALSALFERSRPNLYSGAQPATLVGGAPNGKARASLALSLTALGLNALSNLIFRNLGLAISIIALILLVVAIILGHLARREIRLTGQRGGGMALAGMLIGYIVLGLDLTIIIVSLVAVAAITSSF